MVDVTVAKSSDTGRFRHYDDKTEEMLQMLNPSCGWNNEERPVHDFIHVLLTAAQS